ncbi:MAG: GAF domain-containing protein [Planctomycetes bacterium]|nr:GAF domain-containing protein [Planctomycetota bacterium]
MIQLKILKGGQKGTVFKLKEDSFSIGRALANEVILYDDKVSTRHANIIRANGRNVVRDLGSTNGTLLNNKPIESAEVKPGDILRMGDTVMSFHIAEPGSPTEVTSVRLIKDKSGGPTIHETIRSSEGSTIFNVGEVSIDSLVAAHRNLEALYRVNSVLSSTFDLSELFQKIMDQIFNVTRADRGVLMVLDERTEELEPKVSRTRNEDEPTQLTLSRTIVNQALHQGSGVLTSDAMSDDRFSSGESVAQFHIRSAMCVPIRSKAGIIGIIYVDSKISSGTFDRSDLELLTALGNEAGVAIENAKLYEANVRTERLAALGEALAGLSHYIKNVLMCMQGGGQLVQRALEEDNIKSLGKGWNIVRRNERKLSGLVMDMLSYCKERRPLYEQCNLREVISDVIELTAPLLEEKSITVEHNLAGQELTVYADSDGLARCLLNIFTNAADAVEPETGTITIKAGKDESANTIFVATTDNGSGIPPDVLPNIFEAFCSTKGSKGTGLGLAVVDKVVKEHGGKVEVESEPGKGSTFTIHLPIDPPAEAQTMPQT